MNLTAAFQAALGLIVVANVLLSGDHAVVIAMAARALPAHPMLLTDPAVDRHLGRPSQLAVNLGGGLGAVLVAVTGALAAEPPVGDALGLRRWAPARCTPGA